ncbi:M23 family metallopeptidase [Paenibacillus thermoaerophilus]|nr:M23 family metallopeptidase [Paenibacillus thermoaerophilus]TMV06617.1 M23 family metallopeptidase [Paenibacillus thermoaerophilus]
MKSFRESKWMENLKGKWIGLKSNIRLRVWMERSRERMDEFGSVLRTYRQQVLKSIGALGVLVSVTVGGNQYVQMNTHEVHRVLVGDTRVGVVSNPEVVRRHLAERQEQLAEENPDVQMVLETDKVAFEAERVFNGKSDDAAALAKLDELLKPKTMGTQLFIDGKLVGIVKDQETANQLLETYKQKFSKSGSVTTLSSSSSAAPESVTVESVSFVEQVETSEAEIQPDQVMKPEELLKKLETGDVAPTKYTVVEGDCVGCIAQKLGISKQVIYDNNPWIKDDMIRVGDVLDLTVLQPSLTVKTVELVEEEQEMHYETEYQYDDTMRAGMTETIKAGSDGKKLVKMRVTKINGLESEYEVVDEKVIVEPVKAIVKKGTKVIKGEGTGKFAWPVVGARISSPFGTRWGKLHKGVDLIGNRNIRAADNGVVVYAGDKGDGYGKQIVIDHKNGYRTLYGHLSKIGVSVGKVVEKGESIGTMGSTGQSTGVHLHFEIQKSGKVENPLKYLSR